MRVRAPIAQLFPCRPPIEQKTIGRDDDRFHRLRARNEIRIRNVLNPVRIATRSPQPSRPAAESGIAKDYAVRRNRMHPGNEFQATHAAHIYIADRQIKIQLGQDEQGIFG